MNPRLLCILLVTSVTCGVKAATDDLVDEDQVSVTQKEVVRGGQKVSTTRVTAKDCSQAMTQSTVGNDTVSDVFDDIENEVSVVLLSATPNVCYVRDITGTRGRCQDGSFKVEEGQQGGSQVTEYHAAVQMDLADLPERVAALCKGRIVLKITSTAGGGNLVQKRGSPVIKCVKTKTNCRKCTCVGWLFRKRTCQTCCDETEECTTIGGR